MATKKNQHFVPKLLLKRWAAKGHQFVKAVVLEGGKIITRAPIKSQCSRDYMYGKHLGIEDALGQIEGDAVSALDFFDASHLPPTATQRERISMLLFLLIQRSRTESAFDEEQEFSEGMMKMVFRHDLPPEAKLWSKLTQDPDFNSKFIFSTSVSALPFLCDLGMRILEPAKGFEFVLGDHPTILMNQAFHKKLGGLSGLGWAMSGIQALLPISPFAVLMIFDKRMYCFGRKNTGFRIRLDVNDTVLINSLQILNAKSVFYVSPSTSDSQIGHLLTFAPKRLSLKSKVRFTEYISKDGNSIIGGSRRDLNIDITWTFCRVPKKARVLASPERWGPRDPTFCSRHREFFSRRDIEPASFRKALEQMIEYQCRGWRAF